jgi:U3 small nucleolar RNA-associated protein 20
LLDDPLPTLVLLNTLAETGYLAGGLQNVQGGRWRQYLVATFSEMLNKLADSSLDEVNDRRILGRLLPLLPTVANDERHFISPLISLIRRFTLEEDAQRSKTVWEANGVWNDSHVLVQVLRHALSLARSKDGVRQQLKAELLGEGILNVVLRGWNWNRELLEVAADFIELWGGQSE